MKKRSAGLLVGIASAIGVLLIAFADVRRKSPGPVSAVHGQLEALAGGQACAACHGGWFGSMQKACSECHGDIAAQRQERRGLHGALEPSLAANCSACHSEHHGTDFQMVNRLAFSQAGIADVQAFDHRRVGFDMQGAHLGRECKDCHRHAEASVLAEGNKRFLGLSQDCASCHANPHGDRMQLGCTSCHSQQQFAIRFVGNHDEFLSLGGAHQNVGCRDCHAHGTANALEALAPTPHREARGCGDCHESPHQPQFLAGNASAAGVAETAVCATCHPLDREHFADPRATVTTEQHAHGGFPLVLPHAGLECRQCHEPGATYVLRHPQRQPGDCRACHQDPHGGQFDGGPFAQQSCVGCHTATQFAPHEFDLAHHARTSFPLDGRHADLACARCHTDPPPDTPRKFHGTQNRCEQCHADAHDDAFARSGAAAATATATATASLANPRGTCAECHRTSAFADVDHAAFDHAKRTGFPIQGAHAQVECTDCHTRNVEPDATGRRFGRIAPHGEGQGACTTCHDDPHGGQFDTGAAPAAIDGRTGCQRCHDAVSFRALPHGFAHGPFTGFELVGKHAALGCASCHPPLSTPDAKGRTSARPKGKACADCHADPHQGQFARLGSNDCARCHKSQTTFTTLSFRHSLDSRFDLGDQHAQVPCASCHKTESFGAAQAVRYKPLPTECVDCHKSGGAPFRRRGE